MTARAVDYSNRQGVLPISWDHFHGICKALALAGAEWRSEVVLAVGRGGFYPGTLVAHMLRIELYPVRLTRRVDDVVVREQPLWILEPPPTVVGRRALVVDEISSSGATLAMVKGRTMELGAAEVKTAVLYAHSWGTSTPDAIGLISDALVLNPWDREIVRGGTFEFHPEYVDALRLQGRQPDASMLIPAPAVKLAKGPV